MTTPNKPLSRQRKWQMKQKAKGLCALCKNPITIGSANHCKVHVEKNKAISMAHYQRALASGMCPQCRKPSDRKGRVVCSKCRIYFRNWWRNRRKAEQDILTILQSSPSGAS